MQLAAAAVQVRLVSLRLVLVLLLLLLLLAVEVVQRQSPGVLRSVSVGPAAPVLMGRRGEEVDPGWVKAETPFDINKYIQYFV